MTGMCCNGFTISTISPNPKWDEAGTAKEKTELKLAQALADPGIGGSPFQMAQFYFALQQY